MVEEVDDREWQGGQYRVVKVGHVAGRAAETVGDLLQGAFDEGWVLVCGIGDCLVFVRADDDSVQANRSRLDRAVRDGVFSDWQYVCKAGEHSRLKFWVDGAPVAEFRGCEAYVMAAAVGYYKLKERYP